MSKLPQAQAETERTIVVLPALPWWQWVLVVIGVGAAIGGSIVLVRRVKKG